MTTRHEITVRTTPTTGDAEIVVTTVVTDTATVEQTEVVAAKSRHTLLAHLGWRITLPDGRVGHVTEHGDLTSVTGRTGRAIRITEEITRTMAQAVCDARLAQPRRGT